MRYHEDGIVYYKTECNSRGYKVTARISYFSTATIHTSAKDSKDKEMDLIRCNLKRNIDAEISKYARENPVSDGYITIRCEEYADLIEAKHKYGE